LNGVGTRFIHRLAARDVGVDLGFGQRAEGDARFDMKAGRSIRKTDADPGHHLVGVARKRAKHRNGVCDIGWFTKNSRSGHHGGVGRKNHQRIDWNRFRFFAGGAADKFVWCFAEQGAYVTGVDLAEEAIRLAKENFALQNVNGDLRIMNGENLQFRDNTFDGVYAHGVLQYTADGERMIREIHRVLKPGGEAILMVYNRYSWLNLLSRLSGVQLEHEDAPVFRKHSSREFRRMFSSFSQVEIIPERFPVKTRLHRGLKASVYNTVFVSAFNLIPRSITRPFGWHLMAKAIR
jgi:SAM-dependent methyltransferase